MKKLLLIVTVVLSLALSGGVAYAKTTSTNTTRVVVCDHFTGVDGQPRQASVYVSPPEANYLVTTYPNTYTLGYCVPVL